MQVMSKKLNRPASSEPSNRLWVHRKSNFFRALWNIALGFSEKLNTVCLLTENSDFYSLTVFWFLPQSRKPFLLSSYSTPFHPHNKWERNAHSQHSPSSWKYPLSFQLEQMFHQPAKSQASRAWGGPVSPPNTTNGVKACCVWMCRPPYRTACIQILGHQLAPALSCTQDRNHMPV